jgi:hypothetical protein
MRCMACGAEMIRMDAVLDDAVAVPGFEHHTFMCSQCRDVERRLVFTKQGHQGDTAPLPEQVAPPIVPIRRMPVEPTHTAPVQAAQNVPVEPTQAEPAQRAPVETPETVPVEPAHPERAGAMLQTNAWAKAQEKLDRLKERATAEREAAVEAERRAQFNLVWDSLRSVPPPLASSKALSQEKPDEPVRSSKQPIASPAPTACSEPIAPPKPERGGWLWRRFARGRESR